VLGRADDELARGTRLGPVGVEQAQRLVVGGDDLAGLLQQRQAGRGETGAAAVRGDQGLPGDLLQAADMLADG